MPRPSSETPRVGRLGRPFFATDPETLALKLLGSDLVRTLDDGRVIRVRIDETEAYLGAEDRAAHSFGGRRTSRTEPMFGAAGTAYVYFTYGMHFCFNVVAGRIGEPVAVLIRGGMVIDGLETAIANRGWTSEQHRARPHALADGPAKLCKALAIDRELNGIDMTTDPRLYFERGAMDQVEDASVTRTARIGVDYAAEWAARPLRFLLTPAATSRRKSPVKMGKASAESVGKLARVRRKRA